MEEYVILLTGYITIEATFERLSKVCEHRRARLVQVRHLSLVAWIIHPAAIDAAAKLCEHAISQLVQQLI